MSVPSLLAISVRQLRAPEARDMADFEMGAGGNGNLDQELLASLREMELTTLPARGRIPKFYDPTELLYQPVPPNRMRRAMNSIDGAKLVACDSRRIRIRVDDSDNLPFWLEVDIPVERLQKWLALQGVTMTYTPNAEEEECVEGMKI